MKRFDDWPTRLHSFIEQRKEYAFSWGGQDCCLFACDAVLEMTGEDLAEKFRDRYDDATSAARLLKEISDEGTVGGMASVIAGASAIEKVQLSFAQRGDIVLVLQDDRESLGIVSLAGDTLWAPGEFALIEHPLSSATRAWRI